jgi:hypothetical protein
MNGPTFGLLAMIGCGAAICANWMMRKIRKNGSLFSPLQIPRAMATRDFYLFMFLVMILGLSVMAMQGLKGLGI